MTANRKRAVLLSGLVLLALAATAIAYWTASGTGSASASVGTLSAPSNVTATGGSGESPVSVPVSWDASHVSPSVDSEITYTVERSKDGGALEPGRRNLLGDGDRHQLQRLGDPERELQLPRHRRLPLLDGLGDQRRGRGDCRRT